MADGWTILATALVVTFLAELGDKTQLVILALAARGQRWRVILGAVAAFAILTVAAVYLASALAVTVPSRWIGLGSGLLFLAFAFLAWREARADEDDDEAVTDPPRAGLLAAFGLTFVAELGDKTQLAAAGLAAANQAPLWTAIGATGGFAASAVLAAFAGGWLSRRVPERVISYAAAALFALVGVVLLVTAWL